MFRLIKASPTGGDETCRYDVRLSAGRVTLKAFVEDVLQRNQRGFVEVKSSVFTYFSFEYRKTQIGFDLRLGSPFTDIWDWYVEEDGTIATGGGGRVDYTIHVTPNND